MLETDIPKMGLITAHVAMSACPFQGSRFGQS